MELKVLLLIFVVPVVWGYKSGLVTESCVDMKPHHGGQSPQTGPAPFTVTTEQNNYTQGDEIKVTLQSTGSTPFVGFLLQARESGGLLPVGSFVVTTNVAQLLNCNQKTNSAVSHTSNSPKYDIQVTWKPEASKDIKSIQFHATFVQNYQTFWVDVGSPVLKFTSAMSSGPLLVQSTSDPSSTSTTKTISSADCGVTKVCFSQPSGCDPAAISSCFFMSSMSPSSGTLHYEMSGPSDGYIAFGFSDDQMMGNDDIYICGIGSNGLVSVQHAFSRGKTTPQTLSLGNISNIEASMQQGVISCSFTSRNTISTERTTGINQMYYILFAYGSSSNGNIQVHRDTFVSSAKIDISKPQLLQNADFPQIMQAHGALMLIAWMTTSSLGMMVARYLKGMAKGRTLFGKDIWFVVHVTVMSLTVAETIIAFILAFSHVRGWAEGAHSVLGCLVMILALIQPTLALLRCAPQHPRRFLFNLSHAFIGVAAKGLGVAAIFTGLNKIDSTNYWLLKVMGGFVAWEALFYTLLELLVRWKNKTDVASSTLGSKKISVDVLLVVLYFLGNIAFLVALLSGIGTA
ncbi:putative ferric-chelate reductase 1 isoform X2 [Kryptolebias marmoratus]|uniref:Zgc:163022 n=1 Tax=Kryptolebias marmoratus TaxID=37003 RepID=A0A3Q3H2R3_KRYMA|nr:putative ferric-chelate reductase 1 isoform X2 [Kryptolebias marmoratus]